MKYKRSITRIASRKRLLAALWLHELKDRGIERVVDEMGTVIYRRVKCQ